MKLSMVLFALASQAQAMRLCNFFCPMMLDEVCGTDGLITQNLIGCEDLPLDFRYEHIK